MNVPASVGWSLETPAGSAGAVGIVRLCGANKGELDCALHELGIRGVAQGEVRVRDLLGVDHGLVARWSQESAYLMAHGGQGVLRALCAELLRRGVAERLAPTAREIYPEARSGIEAEMLRALSEAPSSLAVDLLLDQPARWASAGAKNVPERDRILNRLIEPPLVVAIGASNIGKSTLANALAGRGVAVVADEPGTTRDHVGVMLDLAGLVVRYVDTPGIRADAPEVESEAAKIALQLAGQADLVLLCGDGENSPLAAWARDATKGRKDSLTGSELRIALRSDLAPPRFQADALVTVRDPESIKGLVLLVRERLLPREVLAHPGPWKFWDRAVPVGAAS